MNTQTLLVALEDSVDADRLSAALRTVHDWSPGRIVVLHVIEKTFPVPTLAGLGGGLILPPPPDEAHLEWLEARASEALRQLESLQWRLPPGWLVRLRVEHGPPAETICRAATEEHASLILLAGHRRGRIGRWLFGHTARRVVDTAPCHVLVLGSGHDFPPRGWLSASKAAEAGRRPGKPRVRPVPALPRGG